MGLLDRIQARRNAAAGAEESRVISGLPFRPWDSPAWRFNIGGPVHPSRAVYGQDKALGLPALYACTRLLAETIASLPLQAYIRTGSGSAMRYNGRTLFDQPSVNGTTYDWLYSCMTSLLLHGNAWGLITGRDGFGYPTGIEWIPPDMVTVQDDTQQPWNPLRTRIYLYGRLMDREQLFHVRSYVLPGRTEGLSPLRAFALTVLSGISAQQYGSDFFVNGGFPLGLFRNQELEIDKDQADSVKESLTDALRKRQPLVIGHDWEYQSISIPPEESQFLATQKLTATQIAAVYGLPPERVGGETSGHDRYSSTEQEELHLLGSVRPWVAKLESAFSTVLPNNRFVRFNTDALLKTDLETRTKIYLQQRQAGLRTVDEIRDIEGLEPLAGGLGADPTSLLIQIAAARASGQEPQPQDVQPGEEDQPGEEQIPGETVDEALRRLIEEAEGQS